ncbi:TPA: hypothetical protein ACG0XT_004740, partial [Escherichia coli]
LSSVSGGFRYYLPEPCLIQRVFAAWVVRFFGHSLRPPILVTAGLLFSSASDDHCRNFCTIFWERDFTPTQPALFVQPVLRAIPDF